MKLKIKGSPVCTECKLGIIKKSDIDNGFGTKRVYTCDRCEAEFEDN
jgi:DNA-directed RNA polymerase subunit RPC12/RpoP